MTVIKGTAIVKQAWYEQFTRMPGTSIAKKQDSPDQAAELRRLLVERLAHTLQGERTLIRLDLPPHLAKVLNEEAIRQLRPAAVLVPTYKSKPVVSPVARGLTL